MSYLPQFVQNLRHSDSISERNSLLSPDVSKPKITYISVFNPDLVDGSSESNEELSKQILSFVFDTKGEPYTESDKLNAIGLCRGIDAFAREFATSPDKKDSNYYSKTENVIKTNKSAVIIKELEPSFFITCKVIIQDERESDTITRQLTSSLHQAYQFFALLNKPIDLIFTELGAAILEETLSEFWSGYIENFNGSYDTNESHTLTNFRWPNGNINYKGFFGLLPTNIKRSSINLNYNCKTEIDMILEGDTKDEVPAAVIVSHVDKSIPKNYGLVYMQSKGDSIATESLHSLYNWLELHDQHNKLDTTHLTSSSSKDLFASPEMHEDLQDLQQQHEQLANQVAQTDSSVNPSNASVVHSTLDLFNPVNITNNLVISPLNATMNGMMSLGSTTNKWLSAPTLSVPSYLKPFSDTTTSPRTGPTESRNGALVNSNAMTPTTTTTSAGDSEDEDEGAGTFGTFLVGLVANLHDPSIHNKLVYLSPNSPGATVKEYSLVIYEKENVIVTLVFESGSEKLDQPEFYEELASSFFEPAINEIINSTSLAGGGSLIGNGGSLSSLPRLSLNSPTPAAVSGSITEPQEFFFILYDPIEKSIKSSFPFLPLQVPTTTTKALRLHNSLYHLHDLLIDVFLIQGGTEFFQADPTASTMNEYFHKFNGGRATDWMFYYIQYHGKYIIVIKNHNPKARKSVSSTSRKPSTVAPVTSSNGQDTGFLNNLSDGIYDYARLGFLDNLGEDVKAWLEGFSISGET